MELFRVDIPYRSLEEVRAVSREIETWPAQALLQASEVASADAEYASHLALGESGLSPICPQVIWQRIDHRCGDTALYRKIHFMIRQ